MQPSFKEQRVLPQQEKLPIKVVCVVEDLSSKCEELQDIRAFCVEKGLMVETRKYNSYKYRYDRDEIIRLPAFHIEVNGRWERTFYIIGRPYQIIGETIGHYLEKRKQCLARKGVFKRNITAFIEWMKRKLHKKTAMEKYKEQHVKDWDDVRPRAFSYAESIVDLS